MGRLRTLPLAVGLLIGLIIGWAPAGTSYTSLHLGSSELRTPRATRGVNSITQEDPIDLGWLTSAKESTVMVLTPRGHGSGVVIANCSGVAYVLTAKHVVEDSVGSEITLVWASGSTDFQRVGYLMKMDPCFDLALITCLDLNGLMRPVPMGEPTKYVLSIGYPCDTFPAAVGIGSLRGPIETDDCKSYLMHSATIWFGNSGGPLFNTRGELVGINVMIEGYNGHAANDRGIAVTVDNIMEFLSDL
jgi:S1-C subfamily serine protease